MNRQKRCCFAGHNFIYTDETRNKIEQIAETLIVQYQIHEFWVGNYGTFDRIAATAIRKLKDKYTHIQLVLVIPYLTKEIIENKSLYYKKFDGILISDVPLSTPKSLYIIKTNEYMVRHSDVLICWIEHHWGGAFKTYQYAKNKSIKIYNIADQQVFDF